MKFVVTYCGKARPVPGGALTDEVFEDHLDDIMNALVDIEEGDPALSDSDMSAKIVARTAEFSVTVECDDWAEASNKGLGAIRSAIHTAYGATPNWERQAVAHIDFVESQMRDASALVPA